MNRIEIWLWPLDADEGDDGLLSSEETERAQKLIDPLHRRRFVAAHARVRRILGAETNQPATALRFETNEFGKPRLAAASSLHFSLSHSGAHAALASSPSLEVGLDLEELRPVEYLELARRHFHELELQWLAALSENERQLGFFKLWTLKEAVVKCLGTGLSVPLDTFSIAFGPIGPRLSSRDSRFGAPDGWSLRLWPAPRGYVCAVAAQSFGQDVEVTSRTFDPVEAGR